MQCRLAPSLRASVASQGKPHSGPALILIQRARHASSSSQSSSTTRFMDKGGIEKGRPEKKNSEPPLRWSNRTLIMLSSAVGASMYMLGVNQGYQAGKASGKEEAAPVLQAPSSTEIATKDAHSAITTPA